MFIVFKQKNLLRKFVHQVGSTYKMIQQKISVQSQNANSYWGRKFMFQLMHFFPQAETGQGFKNKTSSLKEP